MLTAAQALGEYRPEKVLTSVSVARKLATFDMIVEMIDKASFDHLLSTEARICELEIILAQVECNLKTLNKSRKRKRRK